MKILKLTHQEGPVYIFAEHLMVLCQSEENGSRLVLELDYELEVQETPEAIVAMIEDAQHGRVEAGPLGGHLEGGTNKKERRGK